jgi:hypothetical protein
MLAFTEQGSIGNLIISEVFANGFKSFIQNKDKIKRLVSSNITCDGEFAHQE